jgi:anti-sigma factor RsiW
MMRMHPREFLSAYLDGALTPVAAAEMEAHLDACVECLKELRDLRTVQHLLRSVPVPLPHPAALPRTLARLRLLDWLGDRPPTL